jgi:hypothetical protein
MKKTLVEKHSRVDFPACPDMSLGAEELDGVESLVLAVAE